MRSAAATATAGPACTARVASGAGTFFISIVQRVFAWVYRVDLEEIGFPIPDAAPTSSSASAWKMKRLIR